MKITFVLTLATGRDILYATNILFPSILYFFKISDIDKFLIIMNTKDIELFNYYIGKSGIDTTTPEQLNGCHIVKNVTGCEKHT